MILQLWEDRCQWDNRMPFGQFGQSHRSLWFILCLPGRHNEPSNQWDPKWALSDLIFDMDNLSFFAFTTLKTRAKVHVGVAAEAKSCYIPSHVLSLVCFVSCKALGIKFWPGVIGANKGAHILPQFHKRPCHCRGDRMPACPCPSRPCGVTEGCVYTEAHRRKWLCRI